MWNETDLFQKIHLLYRMRTNVSSTKYRKFLFFCIQVKNSFRSAVFCCHCEERSDVAISWYDPPNRKAVRKVVARDCHVSTSCFLAMT